jgi:integrase
MKLTDFAIKSLKTPAARREIPDDGAAGLYLILQPSGKRSFAVRYRHDGTTRKLTLQTGISLSAARKFAAQAMHAVAEGHDPAVEKKVARAKVRAEKAGIVAPDTLKAICVRHFQDTDVKKLRSAYERERVISKYVLPVLGKRPINTILRSEIIDLRRQIQRENGDRMADVTIAVLRKIFGWHALECDTFNSPIIKGMGCYKISEHKRFRTLGDDELRALWHATDSLGVYGALIKFLVLSAARLREASEMTWAEVDKDGTWVVPAPRAKGGVPIVRPLPRQALDILYSLPKVEGCPFPFSLDHKTSLSAFSRWKDRLDAALGDQIGERWVVHDLRRVSRSLMSRAGVDPDHGERVLGHVIGGQRGTYDRHSFFQEKKHALEALAAQIDRIVNPQANVVSIERKRR